MKKVFLSLLAIAAAGTMMAGVTPHFALELGYDHGWAQLRTPDGYASYYFDEAQMDGFHFGGNVQLDFLDGQHKPGLLIGVNYQFLAKNFGDINPIHTLETIEWAALYALGASNLKTSDYAFMHTIQIPVHFHYTYQFNNDWRFILHTGPQVRLHVAITEDVSATGMIDGKKNGIKNSYDVINGKINTTTWLNGSTDTYTTNIDKAIMADRDCFDMSWGFAIGFGWKALSLSLSYDLGMINLYSRDMNGWRYNSDALAVTIGCRIK